MANTVTALAEGAKLTANTNQDTLRFGLGWQEVSREWLAMTQNRLQMNVEAITALSRCRSLPDPGCHTALFRGNVDLTLENSQRLAELSMTVIKEATGNVAGRESTPARHKRAA